MMLHRFTRRRMGSGCKAASASLLPGRSSQHPRGIKVVPLAGVCQQQTVFSAISTQRRHEHTADPVSPDSTWDIEKAAMKPKEIVDQLNRFIIGQEDAKKAVAIALRNRWRRLKLSEDLRKEVLPKNILMIGPTGVGKTEIARRLASLAQAPFIKVEATKYTEVGYHGRDVEQIVRDLTEKAITETKQRVQEKLKREVKDEVDNIILDSLLGKDATAETRAKFKILLDEGALEDRTIQVKVPQSQNPLRFDMENMQEIVVRMDQFNPFGGAQRTEKKTLSIKDGRSLIEDATVEKKVDQSIIVADAIENVEQNGIIVIDEIDKIATPKEQRFSSDASAEGVQRDLLPIIEGCTVNTKHGNVKTDHILFCCAGAFSSAKPSDLLAELQGRLPIRVELKGLREEDLLRILEEPENNLLRQQIQLLETEGVALEFTQDAVCEIARVSAEINQFVENIGARRLHTVIEKVMEDVSFNAPDMGEGAKVVVDTQFVQDKVGGLMKKDDFSKFIL